MPLTSIRNWTNSHPVASLSVAVIVVLAGLALVVQQLLPLGDDPFAPGSAFFTVDDGKTTFVDSAELLPPFEKDGKTAYRVHVFTCDGGKTKINGYLQRLSPLGKEKMKALRESQKKNPGKLPGLDPQLTANIEIKRPGDKEWIKQSDVARAQVVLDVRCPDRPNESAEPFQP
jgi:hypothetical protein